MKKISIFVTILQQPIYALIAVATSVSLGLLYYYTSLSIVPFSTVSEMIGPSYVVATIGLTVVTSILAGVNVSLIIFKIKVTNLINLKLGSCSTTFGSTLAAFTPGCPACTTSLAAILSTIGGIAILPLQGLELKLISITALSFSIIWILRGLNSRCKVKRNDSK